MPRGNRPEYHRPTDFEQIRSTTTERDRIWRERIRQANPVIGGRSRVDIIVSGRNVEVPDHYRQHVAEKLTKVERYDDKIIRIDIELSHEKNPRQSDNCQRVEITCISRGPVVRAEACAGDFYTALDHATSKLDARLRRSADRRRVHRGRHAPISVAEATSGLAVASDDLIAERLTTAAFAPNGSAPQGNSQNGSGPLGAYRGRR